MTHRFWNLICLTRTPIIDNVDNILFVAPKKSHCGAGVLNLYKCHCLSVSLNDYSNSGLKNLVVPYHLVR